MGGNYTLLSLEWEWVKAEAKAERESANKRYPTLHFIPEAERGISVEDDWME